MQCRRHAHAVHTGLASERYFSRFTIESGVADSSTDVSCKSEVAGFLLKDPPLVVTLESDGGSSVSNLGYRHVCWRLTLSTGAMYAVDLTGAQYGWSDLVCQWDECFENRCLNKDALRIGLREDENIAPIAIRESGIFALAPPAVDNYYALVRDDFSRSMTSYLENKQAADILELSSGGFNLQEYTMIEEMRHLAEAATSVADRVWDTFPWKEIQEKRSDASLSGNEYVFNWDL